MKKFDSIKKIQLIQTLDSCDSKKHSIAKMSGPVDPCEPNPCDFGGMCSAANAGGFSCSCQPDYFGERCESNPCSSMPCQNNGLCTSTGTNSFSCSCPDGYFGNECENQKCDPTCTSGDTCRDISGAYNSSLFF
jgi:hypothetical protein